MARRYRTISKAPGEFYAQVLKYGFYWQTFVRYSEHGAYPDKFKTRAEAEIEIVERERIRQEDAAFRRDVRNNYPKIFPFTMPKE